LTTSDVADNPIRETTALLPHLARACRCADDNVIAYRDDDGDWTCTRCGRRLGARATDRQDAPQRAYRIRAMFDSHLPAPWPS
jgi:hypothetical protein